MRILAGFIFWVQVLHYYYHQYQLNGFVLHCSVREYASRLCLKLCLTRKLGIVSLAFATFFCNESLLGAKRRVGCFFHDFKLLICAEVLQWILTSLKFWWCQEFYFFTGGTEKLVMITNSSFNFWMLTTHRCLNIISNLKEPENLETLAAVLLLTISPCFSFSSLLCAQFDHFDVIFFLLC